MAYPRRLVPGQIHATTRRVARRAFGLRPDPFVEQVVLYALGVAQAKYPEVEFYATMVESNHKHDVVKDGEEGGRSRLSAFYREWHSLIAKALNAEYGHGENFWRSGSWSNVEVHGQVTLEKQLLYLWANPVKDGLVERPEDWPGVKFLPEDFGRTITVAKPESAFFGGRQPAADKPRRKSRATLPQTVVVTISRPPGYDDLTLEELRDHFRQLLDDKVSTYRSDHEQRGRTRVRGVEAILAEVPQAVAGSTRPTFGIDPRIACSDTELYPSLCRGLSAWREEYRQALDRWCRGNRDTLFPYGSYWLPEFHGAAVRAPPSAA